MASVFDLTGSVALVTGGSTGIGLGMARALGSAGASLCLWGRSQAKLDAALSDLSAAGLDVSTVAVDVADEHAVDAAMTRTVERHGRLDTVVVNAGIGGRREALATYPTEQWREVLGVNLDGALFTLRAAAARLIEQGDGGSVVFISSLGALEGQPGQLAYSAAKGALLSLTRSAAVELARHRVRVNAVLPGFIETPMTDGLLDQPVILDRVLKRVPVRRWGTAEDFGGIAVYFASPTSSYHTGDCVVIDGGYSIF